MPSPDQLCQKWPISGTAMILENPTFARGFSACSLTQKPERSGGWRSERDSNAGYGQVPVVSYVCRTSASHRPLAGCSRPDGWLSPLVATRWRFFNAEKAAPKGGFQIKADKSASYWIAGQDLNL